MKKEELIEKFKENKIRYFELKIENQVPKSMFEFKEIDDFIRFLRSNYIQNTFYYEVIHLKNDYLINKEYVMNLYNEMIKSILNDLIKRNNSVLVSTELKLKSNIEIIGKIVDRLNEYNMEIEDFLNKEPYYINLFVKYDNEFWGITYGNYNFNYLTDIYKKKISDYINGFKCTLINDIDSQIKCFNK